MESPTRSRTPAATTTGAGDSRRGRGGGRRPLTDCTNTATSPSSSAAVTPKPKRKPPPESNLPSASETDGITTRGGAKTSSSDGLRLPSTRSYAAPESLGDATDCREPWTVYTRRNTAEKRKQKGKAIAALPSRSHVKELRDIGDKYNEERECRLSKSCPIPNTKRQKCHRPGSAGEYNALEDYYIKQQISYFAEVDAFDLLEEEVSPGNESD